ncbi:MAG: 30S ribosomal protein S2, partial [Pseudonocardiales bacterium]
LQRLKELEAMEQNGWDGTATKKEQLILTREKIKLERTLGGIREMSRIPSAVWIVDTKKEHIAVGEAHKLNIPVIAILDTNCDPDEVDYKIPGNDDAIRSAALLTRVIADAVAEGLVARAAAAANAGRDEKPEPGQLAADEPMPEWERELLQPAGSTAAAAPAAEAASAAAASVAEAAEPAAPAAEPAAPVAEAADPVVAPAAEAAPAARAEAAASDNAAAPPAPPAPPAPTAPTA